MTDEEIKYPRIIEFGHGGYGVQTNKEKFLSTGGNHQLRSPDGVRKFCTFDTSDAANKIMQEYIIEKAKEDAINAIPITIKRVLS